MNPILIGSYLYSADNEKYTNAEIYGKSRKTYTDVIMSFEKWKETNGEDRFLVRHFERDWTEFWRYLEYIFHPRWRHTFVARKARKGK